MAEDLNQAVGDSAAQVGAKLGAVAGVGAAAAAAATGGGAPPAGGHFAFEPDQIRAIITDWEDLIAHYRSQRRAATPLTEVKGPGNEYASNSMAESVNATGQKVLESIEAQLKYCESQRDKFQDALNQYLGVEDTNAADINRQLPAGGADQQSSGAF